MLNSILINKKHLIIPFFTVIMLLLLVMIPTGIQGADSSTITSDDYDLPEIPIDDKDKTIAFTDVPSNEYYAVPVAWAVKNNITAGTSKTTFSPDNSCTRCQVVTFLWRAAGEPDAEINNPFVDVKSDAYYYNAVLWAVKEGITQGTDKTHFSPDKDCTRGQVVTFLWRSDGEPEATVTNPFTDISTGDYYYEATLWAVGKDITVGTSNTTFSPNKICTRGQIVTFIYRYKNN